MARIYLDTEFLNRGHAHPLALISVGMIRQTDGRELYLVNADMPQQEVRTDPWLMDNVWAHLPLTRPPQGQRGGSHYRLDTDHPDVRTLPQIARAVADFVTADPDPQLVTWYGAFDYTVISQMYGTFETLPPGFPMRSDDLRQDVERLPPDSRARFFATRPEQHDTAHHALNDARTLMAWAHHYEGLKP